MRYTPRERTQPGSVPQSDPRAEGDGLQLVAHDDTEVRDIDTQ